jgi:hypothetical protein
LVKLILLAALLFSASIAIADEKPECELAVDAADRLAPGSDDHCDYTKSGLNGVLHKAFSDKSEKNAEAKNVNEPKVADEKPTKPEDSLASVKSGEFKTAQELQLLRFNLIEAAAMKCPNGFSLDTEQYLPKPNRAMRLELSYHCL